MVKYSLSVDYYFPHFQQRLKERYNLDITLDEYHELNAQELKIMYKLSANNKLGTLEFKGIEIIVIKYRQPTLLKTALTSKQLMPAPLEAKKRGITRHMFHEDLEILSKEVEKVKQIFIEMNDKRAYFVNKPGGYPDWMYSMAYFWDKTGHIKYRELIERQLAIYRKTLKLFEVQDPSTV